MLLCRKKQYSPPQVFRSTNWTRVKCASTRLPTPLAGSTDTGMKASTAARGPTVPSPYRCCWCGRLAARHVFEVVACQVVDGGSALRADADIQRLEAGIQGRNEERKGGGIPGGNGLLSKQTNQKHQVNQMWRCLRWGHKGSRSKAGHGVVR